MTVIIPGMNLDHDRVDIKPRGVCIQIYLLFFLAFSYMLALINSMILFFNFKELDTKLITIFYQS